MGIRPHLSLLCGIDDLQVDADNKIVDPRLIDRALYDDRYERSFDLEGLSSWTKLALTTTRGDSNAIVPHEVMDLFHHDDEFGVPTVAGHVWDRLGSQETIYALACCYPDFNEAGYRILPTTSEADDISMPNWELQRLKKDLADGVKLSREALAKRLRVVRGKRLAHKYNQNYSSFSEDFTSRHEATLEIFRQTGFSIARHELKLMLYWQWS